MKLSRLICAGAACLVTAQLHAAVPYVFSAGQPAKASEVNANFKNLDDRVKVLESSPSSGGSAGSGGTVYPHQITYSYVSALPGFQFVVGGITYRVIRVPIKGPDGIKYAVTYPVPLYTDTYTDPNTTYVYAYMNILHGDASAAANATISGYPATLSVTDSSDFSYRGNSTNKAGSGYGYWDQRATVTQTANGSVSIDLGSYALSIGFGATEEQVDITGIPASTADYVNAVDLTAVHDSTALINQMDQLVDYIKVERLP